MNVSRIRFSSSSDLPIARKYTLPYLLAGFGFAKYRFPGRTFLFFFVISTMMIPFQILVVPLFIEVKAFGWENSYPGLIIPGMMNAFGVFMMRQYASELPGLFIVSQVELAAAEGDTVTVQL